jgi:hypothetical protein
MGQKPARLSALMKTRAATWVFWQVDRVVAPLSEAMMRRSSLGNSAIGSTSVSAWRSRKFPSIARRIAAAASPTRSQKYSSQGVRSAVLDPGAVVGDLDRGLSSERALGR